MMSLPWYGPNFVDLMRWTVAGFPHGINTQMQPRYLGLPGDIGGYGGYGTIVVGCVAQYPSTACIPARKEARLC